MSSFMRNVAVGVILFGAASAAEAAESGVYAGLGFSQEQFSSDGVEVPGATLSYSQSNVTFDTVQGRLGFRANRFLAIELEAATGIDNERIVIDKISIGKIAINNLPIDLKLKSETGIYGVGYLPLNEKISLLMRIGYVKVDLEANAQGIKAKDSQEGWRYNVGAEWAISKKNLLRATYGVDEFDGKTWDLGYIRQF